MGEAEAGRLPADPELSALLAMWRARPLVAQQCISEEEAGALAGAPLQRPEPLCDSGACCVWVCTNCLRVLTVRSCSY